MAKSEKSVFFFGAGKAEGMKVAKTDAERRMILGGKGAGLADMTSAGLPVPPGFTISVGECEGYYKQGRKISEALKKQVRENMAKVEKQMAKNSGK
jgi:pyruvate,orthophosphate dikinase